MTSINGALAEVPVETRRRQFDVDLGPNRRGGVSAVYSRCAREAGGLSNDLPTYDKARGCDLYEFNFATRRERKLRNVSSAGASEYLPSIWGRRIAFTRIDERRPGVKGHLPHIFVADIDGRGRMIPVPGGTRGQYFDFSDGLFIGGPGPTGLDLHGRHLAFSWDAKPKRCQSSDTEDDEPEQSEIWLSTTRGERRRLEKGCPGITASFFGPTLVGSRLYYGQSDPDRGHHRIFNRRSQRFFDGSLPRELTGVARTPAATYYVAQRPNAPTAIWDVARADGLQFQQSTPTITR
jgi:hypothetical protein